MMKRVGLFIVGFIAGLIAVFLLFYASGYLLQTFGIQFYESERGQQRNINIYLGVSALGALLGGYLFSRKRSHSQV